MSELRKSFRAMSEEQRAELAKQTEVELRTGLELMGKDKKTIQELIALVDPPKKQIIANTSHPLFYIPTRS